MTTIQFPNFTEEDSKQLVESAINSSFINARYPYLDGYCVVSKPNNSIVGSLKKIFFTSEELARKSVHKMLHDSIESTVLQQVNDKAKSIDPKAVPISEVGYQAHGRIRDEVSRAFSSSKLVIVKTSRLGLAEMNPDPVKIYIHNPMDAAIQAENQELKARITELELQLEQLKAGTEDLV